MSIRSANLGLFKIRTINNMQEREIMGKSRRERKRQRERENRIDWLKSVLSASAAALIVVQFVIPTAVYGRSMEPGFEHRDYLLIHKQAYVGEAEPERGDVIVFQSKLRDNNRGTLKKLIKRVIGVPGDIVEIREAILKMVLLTEMWDLLSYRKAIISAWGITDCTALTAVFWKSDLLRKTKS